MYNNYLALAMYNVTKAVLLCFVVPKIQKYLFHIYFLIFLNIS